MHFTHSIIFLFGRSIRLTDEKFLLSQTKTPDYLFRHFERKLSTESNLQSSEIESKIYLGLIRYTVLSEVKR